MEADADRIVCNCGLALEEYKLTSQCRGNQKICAPGIGFTLFLGLNEVVVIVVEEYIFFPCSST